MARRVIIQAFNGKQNTPDETLITYQVGIPDDVLFYTKDGIVYAQWWDMSQPPELISIPAYQLVSIE